MLKEDRLAPNTLLAGDKPYQVDSLEQVGTLKATYRLLAKTSLSSEIPTLKQFPYLPGANEDNTLPEISGEGLPQIQGTWQ